MGGAQIAIVVALLAFAVTVLNIAREVFWPSAQAPDWVGWIATVVGAAAVAIAIAVMRGASGKGPKWLRRKWRYWPDPLSHTIFCALRPRRA